MGLDDEDFKAIEANLTEMQKEILILMSYSDFVHEEELASSFGVPVLYIRYALLVLKGFGLVES
jgi:hypothetical protein